MKYWGGEALYEKMGGRINLALAFGHLIGSRGRVAES